MIGDLELTALGDAIGGEALTLDAVAALVRAARTVTGPDHDESSLRAHGDIGVALGAGGVGVDLELAAERDLAESHASEEKRQDGQGSGCFHSVDFI